MTEAKNRQNNTVLISGASIAGPALALWLVRYGFSVTLVEKAPEVRPGGQAVDFKGVTHRTVLERMGILEEVRQARSPGNGDGIIVDAKGRKVATGGHLKKGNFMYAKPRRRGFWGFGEV
jgi:2-polyprenyl-6-methoxyphenol hydroxylase-like FAD-dependent oxidoreductase